MSQQQHQVQTQTQKQNTYLIQQKLQLLHMMHLSAGALEEYINIQLEENPALENRDDASEKEEEILSTEDRQEHENRTLNDLETYYDDDDYPEYKTYVNNASPDTEKYSAPAVNQETFQEQLKAQLKELNIDPEIISLVKYLIDSLEEDGYLRRSLSDISDDYGFSEKIFIDEVRLEEALKIIQKLDPAGIGARSLQECLLLQLNRKENLTPACEHAIIILRDYFHELAVKNFGKMGLMMQLSDQELKDAFSVISHLSPRPVFAAEKAGNRELNIVPEFVVNIDNDDLEVGLAGNSTFMLRINDQYMQNSRNTEVKPDGKIKRGKDTLYFRRKVEEAKWFIEALQQREKTFMEIIKTIVVLQRDFFLTGDQKSLRPMILQDITDRTGFDLSTISRVTSNKYVQTPYGNILLKTLFSNSLTADSGEMVSAKEIKEVLKEIIAEEDKKHPYNDHEMVSKLHEKGFTIARRTVVKYREALNIPNARMRKELN